MVGLSDIPCFGKALDRCSEVIVEAGIRGLRYLLCYNSLVNGLNSEIKKIEVQEGRVSRRADEERANGKTVENHVTEWQKEVQEIKTCAHELSQQRPFWKCLNRVPIPNPVTRFRLGRKAAHNAQTVANLTASGVELLKNEIAYLPADENIPISETTFQKFESREEAYGKLWEALVKEDGHPIIGIYGMPGVGKTRIMEQAWEDAKDKKIFNKVARANVGREKIDVIDLQNQLAGYLNCHLDSRDNKELRATQLKNSLINAGKTLVILDDVWDRIHLNSIVTSLSDNISKGCKILLTSRKEDVCLSNDCTDPIKIEALTDIEASVMFKDTVGTSKINSLQDTSLAEKVCKRCGALPLLISAIANALKFATEDSWKDALSQLENCDFDEIDGVDPQVYTGIRWSFDNLKNAGKTCILLCSLFSEDAEIEINMLQDLATAFQLLNHRGNVRGVVDNLKLSSLLLEGRNPGTVKMHDIIRDVARSIAAKQKEYAFLFIRGDTCVPVLDDYSTRKLIQCVESHSFGHLTDMVGPNLHTLWLECNNQSQKISNSFFKGFVNLKILVLKGINLFPAQISVQTFDKLNLLSFDDCDLNEMWSSIVTENLKTLRISECHLPNPLDLSKLKSLTKLEVVSDSENEVVIDAISGLPPTLVELNIPGGFKLSDAEGKRSETISSKLNKLTALRNLNIWLEDLESCPAQNIVTNLLDFIVKVGRAYHSPEEQRSLGCGKRFVRFYQTCIEGGGEALVEKAEEVNLEYVEGSRNGFSNSKNREAFSSLRKLSLYECSEMEHLATIPQYEIQQSQSPAFFSKLTSLKVDFCYKMKYLFSASVVKCLKQLEDLDISYCPGLQVVI